MGAITVPGGRKEPGETVYQTCEREMKEETNLTLLGINLSGIVSFISCDPEKECLAAYFRSSSCSGVLKGSDEGDVFWCRIEESFNLEGISPFYRLLLPFVFDRGKRIFHGFIEVDLKGDITSYKLDFEKRPDHKIYSGGDFYV